MTLDALFISLCSKILPKCGCGKVATFYDIHVKMKEHRFFVKDWYCEDCRRCEVFSDPVNPPIIKEGRS